MQSMWQLHCFDWFPSGRVAPGKSRLMQQRNDRLRGPRRKQRVFTSSLVAEPSRLGHFKLQPCSLSSPDFTAWAGRHRCSPSSEGAVSEIVLRA